MAPAAGVIVRKELSQGTGAPHQLRLTKFDPPTAFPSTPDVCNTKLTLAGREVHKSIGNDGSELTDMLRLAGKAQKA